MNLGPLYELREKLAASAIAGVNLIKEDFRLERAIEAIEPLTKAAAVFQKIYDTAKALFQTEDNKKAGILLDTIALVDAVIYTQGTTETKQELEAIELQETKTYQNIAYSSMAPLLEALTTTGSGRLEILRDIYQNHPEYFQDYRIRYAVINALSDNYSELAEQVGIWICEEGERWLPLLKQNFSSDVGKGMIRRIQVIENIAKEKENEFYLSLLETAKKGIREAVIMALRHTNENAETLMGLVKTEKGENKKAAQYALSFMKTPEVFAYWKKEIKKPKVVKEFLQFNTNPIIANYLAENLMLLLQAILEQREATVEQWKDLYSYCEMLTGKDTEEICEIYEFIAKQEAVFSEIVEPKEFYSKVQGSTMYSYYAYPILNITESHPYSIFQIFKDRLVNSLLYQKSENLFKLSKSLYQTYGNTYIAPAFLTALCSKTKEEVYQKFSSIIQKRVAEHIEQNKIGKEPIEKEQKDLRLCLLPIFGMIHYDKKDNQHILYQSFWDYKTEKNIFKTNPLFEKLDERWYLFLTNQHLSKKGDIYHTYYNLNYNWSYRYSNYYGTTGYDDILISIADISSENCKKIIGAYIYKHAMEKQGLTQNYAYYEYLRYLNWTDCQGLLLQHIKTKKNKISFYEIKTRLQILPLTNEQKAQELDQIIETIKKGEASIININLDEALKYLEDLKK